MASDNSIPPIDSHSSARARAAISKATEQANVVSQKLWFLDLKFEQFATPKLIGFVFLLWLVFAALAFVATIFYVLLTLPVIQAALVIVAQALVLLISAVLVRVFLEAFLVVFRIAEHLSNLRYIETIAILKKHELKAASAHA